VTGAGRERFAEWIAAFISAGPREDQLRSPLLLAVFFGSFAPSERLASLVQEYRARHQRSLAAAQDMLGALAGDTSLPGAALLRRAAYETMMIDWLGQVLSRIPPDYADKQPGPDPIGPRPSA
jgi:virulence activator alpha